jgi:hypothetical protein
MDLLQTLIPTKEKKKPLEVRNKVQQEEEEDGKQRL